tara:strand:- start:2502 stop:3773 length:1272 start_codon:yes stop_codon:yes gene_type:complete
MVKGKNIRFIGNVLPATGHKPEGDSTFDFNSDESRRLDLEGVPLRIEHLGSLPIGKVTKSWDGKNGSKWILGEIENDKGFASLYANHAIKPDSNGHTLYPGLSLQHVHQAWADGTTNKRPVEISICGEPRRPDCYIRAVSETGKNEYIAHKASVNQTMSTPESAPQVMQETTESTPVSEAVGAGNPPVEPAVNTSSEAPSHEEAAARNVANSQEELMKMFLAQDGKNNELMQQLAEIKKAKEELEAKWKEREANEQIATQSKAEALSKALVEQWSQQLGPENMTEENKKAIFALAHEHPQASMQMMEIAHKASMKHAGTRSALIESEAMSKKRVLEQQVVDTIMKRRRTEPAYETAHQASTKVIEQAVHKKPSFNPFVSHQTSQAVEKSFGEKNAFLFSALKGASSGSARSVMDSIAKYRNGI